MKKILSVLSLMLALNFLAAAGAVGWLFQSGKLTKAKVGEIKKLVFAPPEAPAATTQPSTPTPDPEQQPLLKLDELLAKHSGHTAAEQVEFIQRSFDTQMAQLERRQRELQDLKRLADKASADVAAARQALEADRAKLDEREQESQRLAASQGFQDSLKLYTSLPARQVKTIFMSLSDDTVTQYLRAMPPRTAAKVVKEFSTPDELARIQRVMEKIRKAPPPAATIQPVANG